MDKLIKRSFMPAKPQEIGKIKLGKRGESYVDSKGITRFKMVKLPYFEVTTRERAGGDGAFIRDAHIHSIVGEEPLELPGKLMFPDVHTNLITEMSEYEGRRPAVRCDGETMVIMSTGEERPCMRAEGAGCNCRPYARLLLSLDASPYSLGYHVFRTRSWESTNNLQTALEEMFIRFGSLFMAPVKLIAYVSEDFYLDGKKERVGRSLKASLVLNMPFEQALLHMTEANERLQATRHRLLLSAGDVQEDLAKADERDAEEIADLEDGAIETEAVPSAEEAPVEEADVDEDGDPELPFANEDAPPEPPTIDELESLITQMVLALNEIGAITQEEKEGIDALCEERDRSKMEAMLEALISRHNKHHSRKKEDS